MKRIALLGSTGSIGEQTLAVVAEFPARYQVTALAAGKQIEKLAAQVKRFRPQLVAVADEAGARELRARLGADAPAIEIGARGLIAVAEAPADCVVSGLVGAIGLAPTLAAVRARRDVALANKEVLVMAGALVRRELERSGATLLPVDSEHSGAFQALAGHRREDVHKLTLTASGGPFRTWSAEQMERATVAEALKHPNWAMGPKITIDSATLANKALEVIEARWLFDLPAEKVAVVVHPQSIVHALVEYVDGSVLAQLGMPDMRVPISLALAWPERLPLALPRLDLAQQKRLDFEPPDPKRFPCLELAWAALAGGEAAPAVFNAANEVAVAAFLAGEIAFPAIARTNARVLEAHLAAGGAALTSLEDILAIDADARRRARECVEELRA
ncbi:MAG: 1-deoxy-D-xylulose-5-phosphate reductoisomerase [Deltaproteobacteria bacterium]|nr:1-deoxy-D-xylulose-5-phosphate reductoisomerase [Deltaproteobacteria bacterium]